MDNEGPYVLADVQDECIGRARAGPGVLEGYFLRGPEARLRSNWTRTHLSLGYLESGLAVGVVEGLS